MTAAGYVLGFVNAMHAHALHEVFLALPFAYAMRLSELTIDFDLINNLLNIISTSLPSVSIDFNRLKALFSLVA